VNVITASSPDLITDVRIFDLYEGGNIGEGCKSVAVGLTLQHPSRTLNDEEIAATVNRVTDAVSQDLKAVLRD
jgi:phenylalanyl-tRNA synthetase beta chain